MSSTNKSSVPTIVRSIVLGSVAALGAYAVYKVVRSRQSKAGGSCCGCSGSSASSSKKPRVVFVLGGPGAGKGTQCAHIVNDYGFVHLSAGDLLRDEQKKGGKTGEMIKTIIAEGKIVPVKVTLDLLKGAMQENMKAGRYLFLIDGFPRNYDNLTGWNDEMSNFAQVDFCLFLECPESVMEARLLKRGETSGRSDDNAESIRKRFLTYIESTKPVIANFEKQGKLKQVMAAAPVETVHAEVQKIFNSVNWK